MPARYARTCVPKALQDPVRQAVGEYQEIQRLIGRSFRTGVEAPPGKEGLTILRRLLAYSEKVFQLSETVIAGIVDRRLQPRIPTSLVVKSSRCCSGHEWAASMLWNSPLTPAFSAAGSDSPYAAPTASDG